MLWPYVLPFKIAFWSLLVLVLLVTFVAPRRWGSRWGIFCFGLVLASVAILPLTAGISSLFDPYRFGTFHHANFEEVDDPRIEWSLPPAATHITIEKRYQGYKARFKIPHQQLDSWFEAYWQEHGANDVVHGNAERAKSVLKVPNGGKTNFAHALGDEVYVYDGPRGANGAGFTLYYSPKNEWAQQEAAYW